MFPLSIWDVWLLSLIPHDKTMSMYSYFMFLRFHFIYSTKLISFSERAFSLCWQYFYFIRDGCKRSGVFVALSLILEKMEIDDEVDIFQVVRTIQIRRPEFFPNFVSVCSFSRIQDLCVTLTKQSNKTKYDYVPK